MIQKFCAFLLYKIFRWKLSGEVPHHLPRLVFVCLPHTSYWDFIIAVLFIKAENIKATIFGKDGFYFFPLTLGYKYFRVVPIKRNQKNNFVSQASELYADGKPLWTAMAPEGTRSKMNHLKSGYYYLAKTADVPIVPVGIDFIKKCVVFETPRKVLESFELDQQALIEFSQKFSGKRPELGLE